jgi:serine phosphatase RsbU (regulator of sigma subunit)/pSer/pThr/pTyr-binding forkhead associated (FHA) protein
MTTAPRLSISDSQGQRSVPVDKPMFMIGRRTSVDLQVISRDVSREHARITHEGESYLIADCGSRFGTFVNGEAVVAPRVLAHGDRIRLGQTDAVDLVFLSENEATSGFREAASDVADLRQMTAILNGLRALGSGRVLDEVLTLVIDSALDVTSAERGFVMLASASGELEFRTGRARGKRPLAGASFATSHKIPREVFETGQTRIVADLLEGDLAGAHGGTIAAGIRHVLCVPLRVVPLTASPSVRVEEHVIGVLYLDGRERGKLLSSATRSSLEAFAMQAALAIESARLYAEAAERAKLERDLRVAAEIQRALLPEPRCTAATFDLAATTVPCRTIGGDFFDYLDLPGGQFGFALGDVAGKGPPAALLAATVQSHFVAHAPVAEHPADMMARLNRALLRRAVEARFATMFYGALSADGRLHYSNAGQEPPLVVGADGGVRMLEIGGPVLGLLGVAAFDLGLEPLGRGDIVVVCSDGVTEARNPGSEEFGRDRLTELLAGSHGQNPEAVLDRMLASVREFAGAEPQADDITALVLRYRGH